MTHRCVSRIHICAPRRDEHSGVLICAGWARFFDWPLRVSAVGRRAKNNRQPVCEERAITRVMGQAAAHNQLLQCKQSTCLACLSLEGYAPMVNRVAAPHLHQPGLPSLGGQTQLLLTQPYAIMLHRIFPLHFPVSLIRVWLPYSFALRGRGRGMAGGLFVGLTNLLKVQTIVCVWYNSCAYLLLHG